MMIVKIIYEVVSDCHEHSETSEQVEQADIIISDTELSVQNISQLSPGQEY